MQLNYKIIFFSILLVFTSSISFSQKYQKIIPLYGKYSIQIERQIIKNTGGYFSINFDSAELNVEKFLPHNNSDSILLKGSLGQPRIVEVSYIPTNDSTLNVFNSYEKNIDPKSILSFKFYCTPGNNTIILKNNTLVIKHLNQYQKDYNSYIATLDKHVAKYIDPVLKKYDAAVKNKDSVQIKNLSLEYQKVTSDSFEAHKVDYPFIQNHPNSPVSLYVLSLVYSNNHLDEIKKLLSGLSSPIQALPTAINIKNLMNSAQVNAIGKYATDFTIQDTSNKVIKLSDYKGKYVLIDFWASWCAPCRAENPNVVKAFNQYKDKKFTILSVSLDDNRNNWLNAVKHDQLAWSQVSELKGWDGQVSHDYAVTSIPTNFLIDPNGKIIARNLRGDDLENTLKKYL